MWINGGLAWSTAIGKWARAHATRRHEGDNGIEGMELTLTMVNAWLYGKFFLLKSPPSEEGVDCPKT